MTTYIFLLGDADRVRDGIDQRLLSGQLAELKEFSTNLTRGIAELVDMFQSEMDAEVIMAGGDDVLLQVSVDLYSVHKHLNICSNFRNTTGCNISFGVSRNLSQAYLNLRRAKSQQIGICSEESMV